MKFIPTVISAACFLDIALAQLASDSTCYFANGTALPDTYREYQACPGSSICCGINRSNPSNGDPANGFTKDECLPNGLCQNRETVNGIGKVSYWVDFCTKSDVSSEGCLNVCQQTKNSVGNTPMVPCDGTATSERWCCGSSKDCCTSNVGIVRLAQVLGGSLSSSVTSSTTRTSSTLSSAASSTAIDSTASSAPADKSSTPSSTSAAPAPVASGSSSSSLSGGAIAGIVVGAIAGLTLIAAAIFFARRASKWKQKASGAPETGGVVPPYTATQDTSNYAPAMGYEAPAYDKQHVHAYHSEADGGAGLQELPAESMGNELPTNAPKRSL